MPNISKYAKLKAAYDKELRKPLKDRSGEAIEPVYCQTILADFTAEALVHQHKANPRALAVFFDELYGFVMNFNKYRSGSDEQMWTQLFNGGGTIVNRVSSDPVKVDDTCISIFGGIQPGVLKDFSKGKIENGFIDRWLFAYPDKVPYPKLNENEIDPRTKESWAEIVNRIHDLPFDGASRVLRFSPEAKAAFTDWYNNLSNEKNSGGDAFAGLAAKMDKYCARFALILEVLKYGCRESDLNDVSLESTRGAIALLLLSGLRYEGAEEVLPQPSCRPERLSAASLRRTAVHLHHSRRPGNRRETRHQRTHLQRLAQNPLLQAHKPRPIREDLQMTATHRGPALSAFSALSASPQPPQAPMQSAESAGNAAAYGQENHRLNPRQRMERCVRKTDGFLDTLLSEVEDVLTKPSKNGHIV